MKSDREILRTVLELSRNLELYLSILPGRDQHLFPLALQYFDDILPHASRICTLSVFVWNNKLAAIPHQARVELPKLQHFLAHEVHVCDFPFILPAFIRESPLETFHYAPDPPGLFEIDVVPTARLRDLRVNLHYVNPGIMDFIESFPLQFLHLGAFLWDTNTTLSSTTLTRVKIRIDHVLQLLSSCRILGTLPNLLHLSILGMQIGRPTSNMQWPDLPSLLSLHIAIGGPNHIVDTNIIGLLGKTPRLVALHILDHVALEMVNALSVHWEGAALNHAGDHLRLLRITVSTPISAERHRELSKLATALHERSELRVEWFSDGCRDDPEEPTSIATGSATIDLIPGDVPQTPLSECVEQMMPQNATGHT